MISITSVVLFVVFAVGACLIYFLLDYFIDKAAEAFPRMAPATKVIKLGLLLLAILVVIGLILSFMGHPMVSL